jgi:hypothetical protein
VHTSPGTAVHVRLTGEDEEAVLEEATAPAAALTEVKGLDRLCTPTLVVAIVVYRRKGGRP